jgi:solute carrier family 8 (sodium/calcium exchanger)
MALGSSAPEILLSVIQTLQDLDAVPPVLGPSTIVGSAAFNLLVISGLSILAVEEPKKVN